MFKSDGSRVEHRSYYLADKIRKDGGGWKESIIYNLSPKFNIDPAYWKELADRIETLLRRPSDTISQLIEKTALDLSIDREANRIVNLILRREDKAPETEDPSEELVRVKEIVALTATTAGGERILLKEMGHIGYSGILEKFLTKRQAQIATLLIVARALFPSSEEGTARWAADNPILLKYLGLSKKMVYPVALHRAADRLLDLKDELERAAFQTAFQMEEAEPPEEGGAPLGLDAGRGRRRPATFFFDLANTYFEGQYEAARPAKRGFSKEKRSDCKLVGLAAACDRNGTVLKTQLLPGNVSEPSTLKDFLAAAGAAPGDMVVADEGIATEDNLKWLEDAGFHYIVADRRMKREFDESLATVHGTASGRTVRAYRAADEAEPHRIKIACHSEGRESKEVAMLEKMLDLYESELKKLRDGLSRPGTVKNADRVSVRLGRLAERYGPVGQYVEAEVVRSEKNPEIAVGVKYARREVEGSKYDLPGVYNIITNDTSLSDLEILKTYFSLTTIEAVFKALKGELGLRPVYHKKDGRVESHIFISTLAYQLVNGVRRKLMAHGINDSWDTIRENQGGAKVYLHGRQVPRRR